MFSFKVWFKCKFKVTKITNYQSHLAVQAGPLLLKRETLIGNSTEFFFFQIFFLTLNRVNKTICVPWHRGKSIMKMWGGH